MPPLYEYRCPACGKKEEFLEPVDAPTLRQCPGCLAQAERVPSLSSFVMSGFKNGQPA